MPTSRRTPSAKRTATKKTSKRTPEGRKIAERYLRGLSPEEKRALGSTIDKRLHLDVDDRRAYQSFPSDKHSKARGLRTVPSKYKKAFLAQYGKLPPAHKPFLQDIHEITGVDMAILEEVRRKGLAAWRSGHRPTASQQAWARARIYSFVTLGHSVLKDGQKMPDYALAKKAGLL